MVIRLGLMIHFAENVVKKFTNPVFCSTTRNKKLRDYKFIKYRINGKDNANKAVFSEVIRAAKAGSLS